MNRELTPHKYLTERRLPKKKSLKLILIHGLQKDKAVVDKIANSLQGFVNSEIKP